MDKNTVLNQFIETNVDYLLIYPMNKMDLSTTDT